ncbi:GNAT family N-acetyltransferase [Anaerotignum sp.]|uniref:GNAT family N-acetyltransferase n=1 Tax=Anaerotignum sp. TaxID=2039241 RepID=UPI0028A2D4E3|nr:N-acetyltransferase family protein [Anaerotignum sp.]
MNIVFEKLGMEHQKPVMEIFNYYVATGTSAFPPTPLPEQFYPMLMKRSEGLCAYAVVDADANRTVGFCSLSPFQPFSTFQGTANISYFIAEDYTAKGIGAKCLSLLEQDSKVLGVHHFIAEISSENQPSIQFHKKNGFLQVGEFKRIGEKFGREFNIVLMQKML